MSTSGAKAEAPKGDHSTPGTPLIVKEVSTTSSDVV